MTSGISRFPLGPNTDTRPLLNILLSAQSKTPTSFSRDLPNHIDHQENTESASVYLEALRKIKLLGMRDISLKHFEALPVLTVSSERMGESRVLSECLDEPRILRSACKRVEALEIIIFFLPVSTIGFATKPCVGGPNM